MRITNYLWDYSDILMARKFTYNELEQTVSELEQDLLAYKKYFTKRGTSWTNE